MQLDCYSEHADACFCCIQLRRIWAILGQELLLAAIGLVIKPHLNLGPDPVEECISVLLQCAGSAASKPDIVKFLLLIVPSYIIEPDEDHLGLMGGLAVNAGAALARLLFKKESGPSRGAVSLL